MFSGTWDARHSLSGRVHREVRAWWAWWASGRRRRRRWRPWRRRRRRRWRRRSRPGRPWPRPRPARFWLGLGLGLGSGSGSGLGLGLGLGSGSGSGSGSGLGLGLGGASITAGGHVAIPCSSARFCHSPSPTARDLPQVIDGMLTVRKIENVAVGANSKPKLPIVISQCGVRAHRPCRACPTPCVRPQPRRSLLTSPPHPTHPSHRTQEL